VRKRSVGPVLVVLRQLLLVGCCGLSEFFRRGSARVAVGVNVLNALSVFNLDLFNGCQLSACGGGDCGGSGGGGSPQQLVNPIVSVRVEAQLRPWEMHPQPNDCCAVR
jgi:hypothetical protein